MLFDENGPADPEAVAVLKSMDRQTAQDLLKRRIRMCQWLTDQVLDVQDAISETFYEDDVHLLDSEVLPFWIFSKSWTLVETLVDGYIRLKRPELANSGLTWPARMEILRGSPGFNRRIEKRLNEARNLRNQLTHSYFDDDSYIISGQPRPWIEIDPHMFADDLVLAFFEALLSDPSVFPKPVGPLKQMHANGVARPKATRKE